MADPIGAVDSFVIGATNVSLSAIDHTQNVILPTIFGRLTDLIIAPWYVPNMLWILGPLVVTLVLLEFYFGRYEKEELGWNTAVGNSLVLFFVSLDLLRTIYDNHNPINLYQIIFADIQTGQIITAQFASTLLALSVLGLGILLVFVDFFHILPKKIAFFVSSALPINLIAYVSIVLVYGNKAQPGIIPYDWITAIAALLLFILLLGLFAAIKFIEPKAREEFKNL